MRLPLPSPVIRVSNRRIMGRFQPFTEMYCLPNQSMVRRYRFTSFLILLKWLLFTVSVPLLGYAVLVGRRDFANIAIVLMGVAVLASIGHWLVGLHARCPMCFVSPFSHRQHSKSWKASHFLGSYRVFVAGSVLFRGFFHCPYCGEKTAVKPRKHHRK